MAPNDNKDLPWFRRLRPDGSMEPHVSRGDNGEIVVMDNGWFAYFKDGAWHDDLPLYHEQLAEFTPVQDRDEVYRLYDEARAALDAKSKGSAGGD
jgi:hypothetical protein